MIIEMACNVKLQAIFLLYPVQSLCTFIQGLLNERSQCFEYAYKA